MTKATKVIGAIIIIILVIWGISAAQKKNVTSQGPVKIGGAYILSGPVALVGELQRNATAMAVKEINDAGGINGRPFEVVMEDAQYEAKTAVNAYQALRQKGIKFIIADGSPVAAPIRPMAVADGNFMMVPGATAPSYFDGDNRTCRIALTAKNFGPAIADALVAKGYKKVATFYPENESGRGFYDEFTKAFAAKGGEVVVSEFYSASGSGDYRTNLAKIKAKLKEVDAIVMQQVLNTIEPMFKQMSDLGIDKPIVTDYYTINNPAFKNLSLANGIEFIDYEYAKTDKATDSKRVKDFKANYRALYDSDPTFFAASTYDSIYIIADAIKEVGDDPAKVGAYVSKLKNYPAITGTVSFNDDCEVDRTISLSKVVDGRIVISENK
ncbi:MAG TPA: ABC transporter substrate-binding protein [Candidatus Paceibacterota bacterium]